MDFEYYYKKSSSHVPAFGSWDWNNDMPFTQCFESARQAAGLLRYSYSQDRDLYVAGDLYENDVVTPAMIVLPRRRGKARQYDGKEGKKQRGCTSPPPPPLPPPPPPAMMQRPTPKPVDEDLYKISPELLYAKTKKKRGFGFFSSCLLPTCVL
ncbi:uncharacterized protein LOC110821744 [Carica papaya]|uniref:uncharacterized protein LOC110821744 n=1 Tax=Carica papaya TaxID=3649 RepID=UPI000B8C8AC9|nr:uncharacterized protein LOC110821744 [Carica papaya]